jgi:molecular chaperone GrpE
MHKNEYEDSQRVPVEDANPAPGANPDDAVAVDAQLEAARTEQLRLLAEMDNLRKRVARDVESARKFGAERLLGDLMPVCDSLEAGLRAEQADPVKLREGLQLTWRMLQKALESNGLRLIDPIGEPFDPQTQQAVNTVESGHYPPGTVAAVLQKGYVLNDRLLRPALVSVAAEPAPPEDA